MISYLYIHVYSRSHFIIYAVCIIIIISYSCMLPSLSLFIFHYKNQFSVLMGISGLLAVCLLLNLINTWSSLLIKVSISVLVIPMAAAAVK